jgi:hypothetical protein
MTNFYFATDGNWGGADGLVVVSDDGLDEHFTEYVDSISEYDRPEWAEWFAKNDHAQKDDGYGGCDYCDNFSIGSLLEIDKALE